MSIMQQPTYTPEQYAAALAIVANGRPVTARIQAAARKLAAQNAESSRRYADAYAAIADAYATIADAPRSPR